MKTRLFLVLALAGVLAASPPLASGADTPSAAAAQAAHAQPTDAQLDQMLAPIALYPDQLLTQILMAATYPLEVVEADRWVRQPDNAALTGEALDAALKPQPWAPSVKSLVPFPQLLHMMDDNLSWTEQLGDAFLADEARVMDAVQRLRRQAKEAGHLDSTAQQTVQTQGSHIVIVPAAPDVVYVPVYDPYYVYGPWPYPAYPPYYFTGYFGLSVSGGFGWFGFSIVQPLWGWGDWDWNRGYVVISPLRYNALNVGRRPVDHDRWRHDPWHRHGVPYPSAGVRERYRSPGGPETRRFRGYPMAEPPLTPGAPARPGFGAPGSARGAPGTSRGETGTFRGGETGTFRGGDTGTFRGGETGTFRGGEAGQAGTERRREFEQQRQQAEHFRAGEPQRPAPPAFESFGRSPGEIRMQSERGFESRRSQPGGGGAFRRREPEGGGGFGGDGGGFGGRGRERR